MFVKYILFVIWLCIIIRLNLLNRLRNVQFFTLWKSLCRFGIILGIWYRTVHIIYFICVHFGKLYFSLIFFFFFGSHSLLHGNLPLPGVKPGSPALQAHSLPCETPGKPMFNLKSVAWITCKLYFFLVS